MAKEDRPASGGRGPPGRVAAWGAAALLLVLPYVTGAPWTLSDYVFAGMLFGLVGLAFQLAVGKGAGTYSAAAGVALTATFLTIWVNGAAGMIGSENNPYNLLFGGVLALALAGGIVARFEAPGMVWAMVVTAAAQAAVGAFGLPADLRGGVLSTLFAGLWLLSAALFRKVASREAGAEAAP